jgi:hypothetical protein
MSHRAASTPAPGETVAQPLTGRPAIRASAAQPAFRQWSRTEIPGSPAAVFLAQK